MDDIVIGHIYVLRFPNGKGYVGQTTRTIEERMRLHWSCTKRVNSPLVSRAMRKYGWGNVKIEKVLILNCTQEYLDTIEDAAIKYFNTRIPVGYNVREGGSRGRFNHSEEAKVKISLSRKGKPNGREGKHHSEETKVKIGRAHKGKILSEEHKMKLSFSHAGKCHSEETRLKMSASKRGGRNTRAKLTQQQAEEVRNLYIPYHKEYGATSLARKYGIDYTNILRIVRNKSYVALPFTD